MKYIFNFLLAAVSVTAQPTDNPVESRYGKSVAAWTDEFDWDNIVSINDYSGADWNTKLEKAQKELSKKGGGVVFFPAGIYFFQKTVKLKSHIVLRGENPVGLKDAYDGEYQLSTQFEFPKYEPSIGGQSNNVETAFKGIRLEYSNTTTHCGVINIAINRGHIKFGADVYQIDEFAEEFEKYGRNHIVFGCILRNAAIADPNIPHVWQQPWQVWTHRHNAAIDIRAAGNVLVANNRIPESGEDDFLMPGYAIKPGKNNEGETVTRDDITFRYDNRPGIYVNYGSITGSVKEAPHCYAKGIDIRDNYIYNYGCMGIGFSGDGTYCCGNVIRFKPNNYLPIYNGTNMNHHVNNNRAIEMRALRWTVEYNNYEVYSNTQPDSTDWFGKYGDGEGLMHEQHDNMPLIKDSKLRYNIGNRYLCLWRTPIDGLEIVGNIIRTSTNEYMGNGSMAICIQGQVHQTNRLLEIKNLRILNNITSGSGIRILGIDKGGNIIKGNQHMGPGEGIIESSMPGLNLKENTNYKLTDKISYGAGL
ncbi:MAG: hypothetical protein AAFO07_01765 [Bacteroidota bacterium]